MAVLCIVSSFMKLVNAKGSSASHLSSYGALLIFLNFLPMALVGFKEILDGWPLPVSSAG